MTRRGAELSWRPHPRWMDTLTRMEVVAFRVVCAGAVDIVRYAYVEQIGCELTLTARAFLAEFEQVAPPRKRPASTVDDLTGRVFGRLTVTQLIYRPYETASYYRCTCSCGGTHEVARRNLVTGRTLSCGCLFLERVAPLRRASMLAKMKRNRAARRHAAVTL